MSDIAIVRRSYIGIDIVIGNVRANVSASESATTTVNVTTIASDHGNCSGITQCKDVDIDIAIAIGIYNVTDIVGDIASAIVIDI